MTPLDPVAPKSLRELAEEALASEEAYWHGGLGGEDRAIYHGQLLIALDTQAQEAAQQEEKLRDLVREWKWEAYAWAVGIDPAGAKLDKALMECAKELESVLDGTEPTPATEEEGDPVPHGSVIPRGIYGSP